MLSVLNFVLSRKNRVRSKNAHKTTFEEEKNVGLKKTNKKRRSINNKRETQIRPSPKK